MKAPTETTVEESNSAEPVSAAVAVSRRIVWQGMRPTGIDEMSPGQIAQKFTVVGGQGWRWFTAFRRTRPFWGAAWMLFGGYLILHISMVPLQLVMSTGLDGFGGWLCGGGLIICGLLVLAAPTQRFTAGLIGLALSILSLILSNLGGLFAGMLFGILGSSLAVSWGSLKPRKPRKEAK